MSSCPENEYQALTAGVGVVDLSGRTLIELCGADRTAFLHNLCTNDIRNLSPGDGCEAFLTNVQGKVLAHGYVLSEEESLVFDTVGGQAEKLAAHFDKYLIREEVEIRDRSEDWAELLVAGAESEAWLADRIKRDPPKRNLDAVVTSIGGHRATAVRVDLVGPHGFLLRTDAAEAIDLSNVLKESGAVACSPQALETVRIEAGTPLYDRDISEKNLPQEVGRDDRAISFTKGCYLGQETVARIDAVGHVNQVLAGLRFSGREIPQPDTVLSVDGKQIGRVTSATFSPRIDGPLALGYVRRGHTELGTRLDSPLGEVEVVRLPFS